MPPYKYTTQSPNPRTSYLEVHALPGHTHGLRKRRDIAAPSKDATYYQVYCSCKWRDPIYYALPTQWKNSYNDHIKLMENQGRLDV